ncbi:MAG: Brp/Blh family beta-carotene 15,15'-dioxygenase [Bacteroidota bacterium]
MCLFLSLFVEPPLWLEWGWLAIVMLLTGIPHGATDHLVYWHKLRAKGQVSSWRSFLIPYLLQIALYGLLWWLLPQLSLLIFLVLSFYHFGQSQLYYIDLAESHPFKKFLYLLWGGGVLSILLLGHPVESIGYLKGIVDEQYLQLAQWQQVYGPLMGSIASLWAFGMIVCWQKGWVKGSELARELLVSVLLGLCLHVANLWIGFGLYFGLWHATKTIRAEIKLLSDESISSFSWRDWVRQALPFSLLSFVGLGLLITAWSLWGENMHPVFWFFVGVSMLTLPHMITLEHLYKKAK